MNNWKNVLQNSNNDLVWRVSETNRRENRATGMLNNVWWICLWHFVLAHDFVPVHGFSGLSTKQSSKLQTVRGQQQCLARTLQACHPPVTFSQSFVFSLRVEKHEGLKTCTRHANTLPFLSVEGPATCHIPGLLRRPVAGSEVAERIRINPAQKSNQICKPLSSLVKFRINILDPSQLFSPPDLREERLETAWLRSCPDINWRPFDCEEAEGFSRTKI